jgi:hypothetical protein
MSKNVVTAVAVGLKARPKGTRSLCLFICESVMVRKKNPAKMRHFEIAKRTLMLEKFKYSTGCLAVEIDWFRPCPFRIGFA